MHIEKTGTWFNGLELIDHQGNTLLQTVQDKYKNDPKYFCYSFEIGEGERFLGIKCKRGHGSNYWYGLQLVVGRKV